VRRARGRAPDRLPLPPAANEPLGSNEPRETVRYGRTVGLSEQYTADREGNSWVGPFCTFEARDDHGNVLDLAPVLSGRTVRLTVPGSRLDRVGRGKLSSPQEEPGRRCDRPA
jgi:hypothetical protein